MAENKWKIVWNENQMDKKNRWKQTVVSVAVKINPSSSNKEQEKNWFGWIRTRYLTNIRLKIFEKPVDVLRAFSKIL